MLENPHRYAIGIGAQKCASSWLHAVLASHPEIAGSTPKEVDYFSYYFDRGHRWYGQHFGKGAIRFESSPSYFHDPRAAERLHSFAPDTKIIALLRDPVERAYSNHLHEVAKGHIPIMGFAGGLANNPAYLEQSLYSKHLSRWRDMFGDNLLCLLSEEIRLAPDAAANRVAHHLGISAQHQTNILGEVRNISDTARNPALRHALRTGGDGLRKLGLEEQLIQLKNWKPVNSLLERNSIALRDKVPAMTSQERSDFMSAIISDLRQLAPILGRKTLPWTSWQEAQKVSVIKSAQRYPSAIKR